MLRAKNIDTKHPRGWDSHLLCAGRFAITAHRLAQAVIDGLGIEERLDEHLAVPNGQFELLVRLDRSPRRVLNARQHKIRNRSTLQGGSALNKRLLFRR